MRIFIIFAILITLVGTAYAQQMKSFEDFEQEFYKYKQEQLGIGQQEQKPKQSPKSKEHGKTVPEFEKQEPYRQNPQQAEQATPNQFENAFRNNIANLEGSFTISSTVKDSDFERTVETMLYNIGAGVIKRVSWNIRNADGKPSATFTIEYDSDYKALRAYKNPKLLNKLTYKEKYVLETAKSILGKEMKSGMDDFQKALAVHDYIVLTASYDEAAADNPPSANLDTYTAYGILANKKAVCDGYSKTMNLMLNMAGLESIIVTGTAKGIRHSWNKVKIGGEWYNIDATFDDPLPDLKDAAYHDYFNVTDKQLRVDHTWDELKYPSASATKYNYFLYTGMAATNYEQFKDAVARVLNNNKPKIVQIYIVGYDGRYSLQFLRDMGITSFGYSAPKSSSGVFTLTF